jgi:hypothetical protein
MVLLTVLFPFDFLRPTGKQATASLKILRLRVLALNGMLLFRWVTSRLMWGFHF